MVRLGAWCDIETEDDARRRLLAGAAEGDDPPGEVDDVPRPGRFVPVPGVPVLSPGGISFQVEEFAVLADGRRVRLHAERGFFTLESVEASVLTTVLPDDAEQTGDDHPWEWLAELLRDQGVAATPKQLRTLPYDGELRDRLRARLAAGG